MKGKRAPLYILIVLVVAALAALVFYFAPSGSIETAEVILPTPTPTPEPDDSGEITAEERRVDVTADTVQAVLATLERPYSYSRVLTAETFWSGGSGLRSIDVRVHGANARLTLTDAGGIKNVLIADGKLWIWYPDSQSAYCADAGSADADEYQSLITYEDIIAMPAENINDAGYVTLDGDECIYVAYTDGAFHYQKRAYISIASGLLMRSEILDGESLIFTLSSSVPDISTPDASVFDRPVFD